jgi:hypothetical protein
MIPKLKIQKEEIQLLGSFKLCLKRDLNQEGIEEEIQDQVHYKRLLIEAIVEEIDLDFLVKKKESLISKIIRISKIQNQMRILPQHKSKSKNRAINNFNMNFRV